MDVERPPSAIWFVLRIKMQHYSCDFAPVGIFRIRVEQAQIRDDVLLVVDGQYRIGGRGISDIRIKRRLLHVCASRTRLLIEKSPLGSWHTSPVRAVRSEKCHKETDSATARVFGTTKCLNR